MNTNSHDQELLKAKGITPEQVDQQLNQFKTGFPYLRLEASATVGHGILRLNAEQEEAAIARWRQYLGDGGAQVTKFVPASGAASRMFKALFAFVESGKAMPEPGTDVAKLLDNIDKLPFLAELNAVCTKLYGADAKALLAQGKGHEIINAIIAPEGMNYGNLPKGLLTFHRDANGNTRTPIEEQLVEGAQSAATGRDVRLHFTVSSNHRKLFEQKLAEVLPALEQKMGVKYHITLSEQKPSTDTIAVDLQGEPFRDEQGNLVFRPGGHGALISNLGDIDSEVVFIKNIDNVVPDARRESTLRYKQVIGGVLIEAHDQIEEYVKMLQLGSVPREELNKMLGWAETTLNIHNDKAAAMTDDQLAKYLLAKFDRPTRVCGMVVNDGEPGGGPFMAYNPDGTYSPQILESHQIDPKNQEYSAMLANATHFNPVDLVCYIKDLNGKVYPLPKYVDPATGFISQKSLHGKELRALELPGLWNGAMADWNTIFVEVPASTFNPVKTVNDLLRPAHQG